VLWKSVNNNKLTHISELKWGLTSKNWI